MHLYPERWNCAAQVVEELKTVTYATCFYGGTQTERKERNVCNKCNNLTKRKDSDTDINQNNYDTE